MRKYLTYLICAVCVILTFLALTSKPSDAHTPTVSARCGSLNVNLRAYDAGTTVVVRIGGRVVASDTFSGDWIRSIEAPTTSYRWSLTVDNVETFWDVDTSGDVACTPVTTTTTTIATTTTAAPVVTTTAVQRLDPPLAIPLRDTTQEYSFAQERAVLAFTGLDRKHINLLAIVGIDLLVVGIVLVITMKTWRR